jgi:hypothetical protein
LPFNEEGIVRPLLKDLVKYAVDSEIYRVVRAKNSFWITIENY